MGNIVSLTTQNMDAASFAPYGRLFSLSELDRVSPDGVFSWSSFDVELATEPTRVAIVRSGPALRRITAVERHFQIEQTFIPLTRSRLLFVVAPPEAGSEPDPHLFRAFVWEGGHVIRLHRGCWHSLGSPAALGADKPLYAMLTGGRTDDELRAHDERGAAPELTQILDLNQTTGHVLEIMDHPKR